MRTTGNIYTKANHFHTHNVTTIMKNNNLMTYIHPYAALSCENKQCGFQEHQGH